MLNAVEAPQPPAPLQFWIAHTPSRQNRQFHKLTRHILRVSEMARDFAAPFGASDIAYFLGLLHDLGKFRPEFQNYLWECYLAEVNKSSPPTRGSAPHKQAGALAVKLLLNSEWGRVLSQPLYGHHGGMTSRDETTRKIIEKTNVAEAQALLRCASAVDGRLRPELPDLTPLKSLEHDLFSLEMYVRFIFSCLVDADGLDTEAHNDPEAARKRAQTPSPTLAALYDQLLVRQEADFLGKTGAVNEVRREVYDACLRAAELPPAVFELTVPTGGGKTRSSLAFALAHAVRHNLRRVIYAIPYTSIVDQTVGVFRDIFGSDAGIVLEHHSAIDVRKRLEDAKHSEDDDSADETERWRRLAVQNWDQAALIVTTTVQLFESLFSNRPGACRKLHRLAGSVIVLDEAQCLPLHLMEPIRSGLQTLAEHFGATIVFCTATQPDHDAATPHLQGLKAHPIIAAERCSHYFTVLKRVHFRFQHDAWSWEQVANQIQSRADSCLCVVNTRRQALDLLAMLDPNGNDPDVLHLSTLLCGRHRKEVQRDITIRLQAEREGKGGRVLLVSTSVIEAGVDLDFPRAMRAVGPLDRIIQVAGRCNREGLRAREDSEVVIFTPEDGKSPGGHYRMALERTVRLFDDADIDLDDPVFVTNYFRDLYADVGMEAAQVGGDVQQDRKHLRYREVAEKMRLIEDDTLSVFVDAYAPAEAQAILKEAQRSKKMTRQLWQQVQPFCVALRIKEADISKSPIDEPIPGLYHWLGEYNAKTGIPLATGIADLVIKPANLITSR